MLGSLFTNILLFPLFHPGSAGGGGDTLNLPFMKLLQAVRVLAHVVDAILHALRQAWARSMGDVNNIAKAIRHLAHWQYQDWARLLDVIIPMSLRNTANVERAISDSRYLPASFTRSRTWLNVVKHSNLGYKFWARQHAFLNHFRKIAWPDLLRWRYRYADPQLRQLWAFNPHHRALGPVIMAYVLKHLHTHEGGLDIYKLTGLIINESPKRWQLVEQAALAILNTEM